MDIKFDIAQANRKPIFSNKETRINNCNCLVTRICKQCGKEFQVPHYYGKGDYCSKKCSDVSKRSPHTPNVKCEYCGKMFYKKPNQIARYKHHCCSKECMGLLRKIIYSGNNNPNYGNRKERVKDYIQGRLYYDIHVENHPFSHKLHNTGSYYKEHRYVVEQNYHLFDENYHLFDENYFIVIDEKHYLKPKVSVHHINEITTDNIIENLIPLTRSEYTTEHNFRKTIIRDELGRISGVVKQGELLENHNVSDNQQPSINSNINKGSTTSSRPLIDNAKGSNAAKSALLKFKIKIK